MRFSRKQFHCFVRHNVSTFNLSEYKIFKLDSQLPSQTQCTKEEALKYLEELQRIRRMETVLSNMYKEKHIRGFCHLSSGQVLMFEI